ncbi:MAG: hypothetical protein MUO88_09930 [Desulfobacterales bacterium]|nr:hypothetical protein [Desulfobacterales bacterium]
MVLIIAVWRAVADVELVYGVFFDAPAGKIIPNVLEPVFIRHQKVMVEVGGIIQGGNHLFIKFLRFGKTNRIIRLRCFVRFRNSWTAAIIRLEILDTPNAQPKPAVPF